VAKLVGVRTGRLSLTPQLVEGGSLRLGFVELGGMDIFREALIGAAPLVFGGALLAYAGMSHLQGGAFSQALHSGETGSFFDRLGRLPSQPDIWLWIYLVFAVSTTMFPSPSDRRAWLPVALVAVVTVGVALLAGAGPWLVAHLGPVFDRTAGSAALVCGVCVVVQAGLLLPLWLLRRLLCKWRGMRLV
jgi:hypothetical protein